MTAKANTHGPAENQMNTGFTLDGFPSIGAWVSYALGSENRDLPAFVAIPDPRGVPQIGPANWSAGFLPAVFQGTAFNADKPIANLDRARRRSPKATDAATRDFLKLLNDEHLTQHPGDSESGRPHRQPTNWPPGCSSRPRRSATCRTKRRRRASSTAPTTRTRSRPASAATACSPGGCSSAACASCSSSTARTRWARASATGTGTRQLKTHYDVHGPILDQPVRGTAAAI